MQLYKPGIAWPNADNNPWPIMEEASDEGEYYYKEDVHDQLTQLRANLSLAEEGLANYQQEVQRLQRALNFWLPSMPDRELPPELEKRLGDDIALLAGYDGGMEPEAEQLGWITLNAEPQSAEQK